MGDIPVRIPSDYAQDIKMKKQKKRQYMKIFTDEYNEIAQWPEKRKLLMKKLLQDIKTIKPTREDEVDRGNRLTYFYSVKYMNGDEVELSFHELRARHRKVMSWFSNIQGLPDRDPLVWGWTASYEECRTPYESLEDIRPPIY